MKVLLVRPDGIGDQILCLPVAAELRRQAPGAYVGFLSSVKAAPVLRCHPHIDEIVEMTGLERRDQLRTLFRQGWDAAIFLKPYRRLMWAAFAARTPVRVATGYRWYSFLANRPVYEHRRDFSRHESEYNLGLLRGLGLEPGPVSPPRLYLTEEERMEGTARWRGLPGPRVVIHPGGHTGRLWNRAHYQELVRGLVQAGYGVIVTGSQEEREGFGEASVEADAEAGPGRNLMGRLTLRELMAVIAAAQVLVSGSTGPAHIAAALGVRTVTLFDPRRNMLPIRWKPLGEGEVLRPDVPTCERCLYEACPYWDCLDRIEVRDVAGRIDALSGGPMRRRVPG